VTHEPQFKAVVRSNVIRGEELFWAEVQTPLLGGYRTDLFRRPQENCQAVLCQVLDWSRRQGKELAWDYQLAKQTTMKRLISSGAAHMVGPPGMPTAPKLGGSAVVPLKGEASLSRKESADLLDCEKAIERGLDTFIEVGNALAKIRDSRLYRYRFESFEQYVRERWGMSVRHAHRLVDSAQTATNLIAAAAEASGDGEVTNWSQPTSESQLRPLKGLEPTQQQEVWREASKSAANGQVTARDVEVARGRLHPKPKPDGEKKEPRIVPVEMFRVDLRGDIDATNCHDLLSMTSSPGAEPAEIKNVFEFERDLWVVSLGHHGGNPDNPIIEQEAHRLIADQGKKFQRAFCGDVEVGGIRLDDGGDIGEAYSGDLMSGDTPHKIRRPFEFEGTLWTVAGKTHGPLAGKSHCLDARAHQLIPEKSYSGPLEKNWFAMPSHEGSLVVWKGDKYRLGPQRVFRRPPELKLEQAAPAPEPREVKILLFARKLVDDLVALQALTTFLPIKQVRHLSMAMTHLKNFRNSVEQAARMPEAKAKVALRKKMSPAARARLSIYARVRWAKVKAKLAKTKDRLSVPKKRSGQLLELSPKGSEVGDPVVIVRVTQNGKATFLTKDGGYSFHPESAEIFSSATAAKYRLGRRRADIMKLSRARKL
jgi:hypothetical protein